MNIFIICSVLLIILETTSPCPCNNPKQTSPSTPPSKEKSVSCPPNCSHCDRKGCRSCKAGWYGEDCSKLCSQCPGKCCRKTGHCLSCDDGKFGDNCTELCPANCKSDNGMVRCKTRNGHCSDGCMDGFYGDTCTLPCGHCTNGTCSLSTGKCERGCEDGYHGKTCKLRCGFCSNGRCSQNSGLCEGGCKNGYYGASCELLCDNCPCGTCSHITGHCEVECPDKGRTSSHSSLAITSSGAPESTVRTTSPPCSPNCSECDGNICRTCNIGLYGEDCSKTCSQCPGSCSMKTGQCLSCPYGTFGHNCSMECPGKCKTENDGRVRCNADGGCSNGCVDGYYGETCTLPCGHCLTGICSSINGKCEGGCKDGYHGETCKLTCGFCTKGGCSQTTGQCDGGCENGYYGVTCHLLCKNCSCGTCFQNTGQCHTGCLDETTRTNASLSSSSFMSNPEISVDDTQRSSIEEAEDVIAPGDTQTDPVTIYYTGSDPVLLKQSQHPETSKATVDTAVGVTFALLLMVIAVFVLMCSKYRRILNCNRANGRGIGKTSEKSQQDAALYFEDEHGSPKLTRNNETVEEGKLLLKAPQVEVEVHSDSPEM